MAEGKRDPHSQVVSTGLQLTCAAYPHAHAAQELDCGPTVVARKRGVYAQTQTGSAGSERRRIPGIEAQQAGQTTQIQVNGCGTQMWSGGCAKNHSHH